MTLPARKTLVIGSRGSQLALWQARWVQTQLAALDRECRIEIIHTTGDKIADVSLSKVGGKGLFTKEIEDALLACTIDIAVHSLKDMPAELPPGLVIAAIPVREDPRDALIGCRFADLRAGARVGTSSLRRSAQLQSLRPDLRIEPLRGNVDTRLRKLDDGQYDAIVLASAGLQRLGLGDRIAEILDPAVMCPAVGQGALAIETRAQHGFARRMCSTLDHAPARIAVTAERALLGALGGGCQVPIGGYAQVREDKVHLQAVVVSPDGRRVLKFERTAALKQAAMMGRAVAARLLNMGAREILDAVYGAPVPTPGGA